MQPLSLAQLSELNSPHMFAAIPLSLPVAATIAFASAVLFSLLIVPVVRYASRRTGIVDKPDPERKLHGRETALCGGVAVFVSVVAAFLLTFLWDNGSLLPALSDLPSRWMVLVGAAAAMMLVGLFDDAFTLRGRQKLLAQIVILSVVAGSGTMIETVGIFGATLELGVFAYPITMLWLLGAVNALNLIDGADGMATTAGLIICGGLAALAVSSGAGSEAIAAIAMAGALLGFLVYNKPPASIFLGDAGSMLIGLVVGVLATWSAVKESTVLAAAPVAVLAIPLFDSSIAILRRWLTGRSIYATDRAHLHHLLVARFGPRGMLIVVAVLCLTTTLAAVLSSVLAKPWIALVGAVAVLGGLVLTRSFGHAELSLLTRRVANFCESLVTPANGCEQKKVTRTVQLQGTRQWRQVWDTLIEFAQKHDLAQIKMDLNISWMHEGYHGVWNSARLPERVEQMNLRIPLIAFDPKLDKDRIVGQLSVVARGNHSGIYDTLELLADHLSGLRPLLTELLVVAEVDRVGEEGASVAAAAPAASSRSNQSSLRSTNGKSSPSPVAAGSRAGA